MPKTKPEVLVINDSKTMLNLVTGYLSQLDLQVFTASSAEEGLTLARAYRPDVVLCDIVLLGQSGYAFLANLRADPELVHTPVVLMTGVSAMKDRMRAVDSGADDLLTKPFDKAELISRVKAVLRLKAREDEVRQANTRLRERRHLMSTLFVVGNQLRDTLDPTDIIDDFKEINDQYGHLIGDEMLREVVRRMIRNLRDVDVVARYGGEEFALILPDTEVNSAVLAAERIREAVCNRPPVRCILKSAVTCAICPNMV